MEFYEAIETSLSNHDYAKFRSMFEANENASSRDEMSWDLALLLMDRLERLTSDPPAAESQTETAAAAATSAGLASLQQANLYLTRVASNPKELILVYMQNGAYFMRTEANLLHFVDIMQNLLERASTPKFMAKSLEQVVYFIKRLDLIEFY